MIEQMGHRVDSRLTDSLCSGLPLGPEQRFLSRHVFVLKVPPPDGVLQVADDRLIP